MYHYIGRQASIKQLIDIKKKKSASIVVLTGRRRIGKSRLVKEFCKDLPFLSFSGLPPEEGVTAQDQRNEFARQLSQQTNTPYIETADWGVLFSLLANAVSKGEHYVLLDEISWMAHDDPLFLAKLKNIWDEQLCENSKLTLFLCGSVSSWIERNIISSTGFFGRISLKICLDELSLSESAQLLNIIGFKRSPLEKIMYLSVVGGVPWYLEIINTNLNAEQNIMRLCFSRHGLLVDEFQKIFNDLFKKEAPIFTKIAACLIDGPKTFDEIVNCTGYANSGSLSEHLNNLETAGFIQRHYRWDFKTGKFARLSKYYLTDNYIRFYFKYIEPRLLTIRKTEQSDLDFTTLPGINSLLGLQFESLILHNRKSLLEWLNIRTSDVVCDGPYFQRKTTKQQGCQIDYLIQTRLKTLYVIEIKFSHRLINKSVIHEVEEKIHKLKLPKGFAVVPVLIFAGDLSDSVADSDFFLHMIDIAEVVAKDTST